MNVSIDYTIENIAAITQGKFLLQSSDALPQHLLLDSRKVIFPASTIFFSLKSSHRNSNEFIADLYKKGVQNFVIDNDDFDISDFENANFILVKDVLNALHLLAAHHRSRFKIPVIGITGSNGKTIVKEWLNQLLQNDFNIVRSPKSYNSQIGVPLSVLQMNAENTLAIFEAGISQPGEMDKLEKIVKPTNGVITNIGEAHNEGFLNTGQKINEKLKLFVSSSSLIYSKEYPDLDEGVIAFKNLIKNEGHQLKLFSSGKKTDSYLQIISVEKKEATAVINATYSKKKIEITIPFIDDASVENAITCWCVLLQLNITDDVIAKRMLQLHPVEMRLQLEEGINNCSIINDSYSADINSLSIALNFLSQQKQHQKNTVILSDILQSGKGNKELYATVASLLRQKNIQRLIAVGPQIRSQQNQFDFLPEKYFFDSVEDLKKNFYSLHFSNETILLKGARVFEFEQIEQLLEQKIHQTILSINLTSIVHNLKAYRQLLRPGVKIMAMVKASSYGSGSYEIASLLQFNKADYLAVAYADEGIELRKAGISLPVMVMNPEVNTFNALVQYNLEPEIFSFDILFAFEKYLRSSAMNFFPVHVKLDTGMHRLGFEQTDIERLAGHLKENNFVKVQSVFSHLAASEDAEQDEFTKHQSNIFSKCCNVLEQTLGYSFIRHIANTSAISRHPEMQMDMVRLGIGLYGVDGNLSMRSVLKNVTTLTTTIAQIKNVKAGETVGYGRNAKLEKDSIIATVRIGYADGYPRNLSNGVGKMLVKNILVPVIGNVCMDMTMLDVTGVENLKAGDEVIVFGERLTIQTLAKWSNTISYEIMTGISQRVKRIYFEE